MHSFDFHMPTHLFFGPEKRADFAENIPDHGSRWIIVIGGGSVKRLGYLEQVEKLLDEQDLQYTLFEGIEPNPHRLTINTAARQAREFKADGVIALGGGSVMDASKAIAALMFNGEDDIWPYVVGEPKQGQIQGAAPVIAIPTTAATASEVTPYAVLSDPESHGKAPVSHPDFKPTLAWCNPAFQTSLPATTTQDGAADILSHVFENYLLGDDASPMADRYTEGIIHTVLHTLPKVTEDPDNLKHRSTMMWCSTLALNGMQQAGRQPSAFILHNLEHSISGRYPEIAHGRGLATLYPAYFKWLWKEGRAIDRFAQLGAFVLGIQGDKKTQGLGFIEQFAEWLQENKLYQSLPDIGVDPNHYSDIAKYALKTYGRDGLMFAQGPLNQDQIVEIFELTEKQS
ncbi:MAG: iron-containing alcohol dehydrogenase [Bacteroidota bacterium]